jgi:hypothetical protein
MHQKWKEMIGIVAKQQLKSHRDQLLPESPIQLMVNTIEERVLKHI